jgi:fatty acid desaturase
MQDSPLKPLPAEPRQRRTDRVDSFLSFLSAVAFGYFGFYVGLRGVSDSQLYNLSVDAFTWMAKGLAIGLFLVALTGLAGFRLGALLDAILSGLAMVAR